MPRTVSALFRYPVKGLSAEPLRSVRLQRGCAIPHDRQVAIVHRNSQFDHQQPAWITRRHFTVLAYTPSIARLGVSFAPDRRIISFTFDAHNWQIGLDDRNANEQLNQVLQHLKIDSQPGPYTFAEVEGSALTDSPEPLISLMNTRSLADLQEKTGFSAQPSRFRGNVWFEGEEPWEERRWPGQVLSIGNLQVRVVEEIVRCSAIDVHPVKGLRDLTLLNRLAGIYGHTHFGVLAEVVQSGMLSVGNVITITPDLAAGSLGI